MPPAQTDITQPQPFGAPLAKGVAVGEKLPDGRILVRGLPIFSEVRETDAAARMGAREVRDLPWLEGALRKHRARRELGQAPPMCLRHVFDSPQRVGEFELTHIDRVQVNPDEEPRFTLMGNKVYSGLAEFEAARDHDFRSAEISPDRNDELSALALLKDKAPFFSYPNTVERLAPEAVAAFELFRAQGGSAPQVWAGRREMFSTHETTKEGSMPAPEVKDEKKAPSVEERMEAMAAKFFETMSKRFEAYMSEMKGDSSKKPDADKKPESAAAEPEKKPEAAQATGGPNDQLPPAVSSARPGALPAIPEQFAAKMATQETAILGLKAALDKMQREKDAVALVSDARKTLGDMGVSSVPEAFEARLTSAAIKGGKQGVDDLLSDVKLTMGLQGRAPEAYGVLAGGSGPGASPFEAEVKKTIETFGVRPEQRQRINDLASQYRAQGEHFVRSLAPGEFFKTAQGIGAINPQIHEAYGGLKPTYDPFTGQRSV